MKTTRWLAMALGALALDLAAVPPDPPAGKRWVLNEAFSDEFNGTELDDAKWYDYHPRWKGREPGLFVPENVSVSDGLLKLKGGLLDKETKVGKYTYTMSCAAVTSKSYEAWFGYYECRFKAGRSSLSTTFWLSTRANFDGPEEGKDWYGLELDIQECIGRSGDFKGNHFANGMNSNSHFWYTDTTGEKHNLVAKPSVKFNAEGLPSDDFNIYGCWWRDESAATFYFNENEGRDMTFYAGIKEKPFDQRMAMNLVCETYPFPWIELPKEAELLDPARNTCYYDWVRSYLLVDVDETVAPPPYDVFPTFLRIDEASSGESLWKTLSFVYSSNRKETVLIDVRDGKGREVLRTSRVLQPGLGRVVVPLRIPDGPDLSGESRVRISYRGSDTPATATAIMVAPKPDPPPVKPVVIWSEDFERATRGATSGNNEDLAGTAVRTANTVSGKVVKAAAEFSSASGNVVRLSTGPNQWSSIRPSDVIDLASHKVTDGTRYRISLDVHIPRALARGVGSVDFKWADSDNTSTTTAYNSCERRSPGVWRIEYSGALPVETKSGSFVPTSVLPIIRLEQGVAAEGFVFIDNIQLAIEPPAEPTRRNR